MPKKFFGENKKAVSAKERKAIAAEEKLAIEEKKTADLYWQDDDKHIVRKQLRKEQQELKKRGTIDKKAKNKALLEEETISAAKSSKVAAPVKITRAEIMTAKAPLVKKDADKEVPLENNVNRTSSIVLDARNIVDAIAMLSVKEIEADKNPEKRRKAAYGTFAEKRLKELKIDSPSLKFSQMKQIIFKEWQKSPDNPINKM